MPPKSNKKIKWLIIAGIVAVVAAILLFRARSSSDLPPKSVTVITGTIKESIELSGEITASNYANLHFPVGGLITYTPFSEGDEVAKWSTVASLDSRELEKTLKKQLNTYVSARHDFDTVQDTYEKEREDGDVDQALRRILESSQYDLENSVIDVEIRDLALSLSRLSSPLTGILVASPTTTANIYVGPTDIWQVVDPTTLIFAADLDESDLSRVEVGQHANITLDAFSDSPITTSLDSIAYSSKLTTTGTIFEVEFKIPVETSRTLRLGLNGSVSILKETHENILLVPIEAVQERGSSEIVIIDEGGEPVEKEVQLGVSDDKYYQVLEGLAEGQTIYYGK